VRKKLVEYEQLREALVRRNNQLAELERQLETHRVNAAYQDGRLKTQEDDLAGLKSELSEKAAEAGELRSRVSALESDLQRMRERLVSRLGKGLKRLLKGGGPG
jgi:chromosome segregation ATPase